MSIPTDESWGSRLLAALERLLLWEGSGRPACRRTLESTPLGPQFVETGLGQPGKAATFPAGLLTRIPSPEGNKGSTTMADLINLEPWWRFGAAILLGALIGIEREFVQQREDSSSFAGIRTFAFISLFGALAAFASQLQGISTFLLAYGGFLLLIASNRVAGVLRGRTTGMTTEVVAILTPLLGALVIWDRVAVAAALSVIAALMLSLKPSLHQIARRMSNEDLRATLQFGLISLVILPLLPNMAFGPLGAINPFEIWLLVILVSGISFLGYLLMKFGAPTSGTGLAGLFGGLVSSTATTVSFASRSKENPSYGNLAGLAVILASLVSFPRIVIEVLAVHPPLIGSLALPLGLMVLSGSGLAYRHWRRETRRAANDAVDALEVTNPLRLQSALLFALVFTIVLVAVKYANLYFGNAGLYVAGALSGLTGVDSISLSAAGLTADGELERTAAATAILLATFVNLLLKLGLAHLLGGAELRRVVYRAFLVILVVGAVSSWLSLQLLG